MPSKITSTPLLNTGLLHDDPLKDLSSIFKEISTKNTDLFNLTSNIGSHITREIESLKLESGNDKITVESGKGHLLILQKSLSPYINSMTSFSNLKELTNIEKVIWIDEKIEQASTHHSDYGYNYEEIMQEFKSIVILSDGELHTLELVSIILKNKLIPHNRSNNHLFSVIVTNDYRQSTQLFTDNLGISGDIGLFHWDTYGITLLDSDLVSLELPYGGLKDLYLNDSFESCDKLASYLLKLVVKSNYKMRITNSYVMGTKSEIFYSSFKKRQLSHMSNLPAKTKKIVEDQDEMLFMDHHSFFKRNVDLVVLERGCDLISCLLTQLSYVGLCDELIGTKLGSIEVQNDENDEFIKFKFNSPDDEIYHLIKNLNFSMIGGILNSEAKNLQDQFDKRHGLQDIDQMKKFVGELGTLKERQKWVKNHTVLAENILKIVKGSEPENDLFTDEEINVPESNYFNSFIELQQDILGDLMDNKKNCLQICEFIYKYEPKIQDVLKLLIMTSIVKNGIREQEYNIFRKEIMDTYGIKYMKLMITLAELGIIYPRESQFFSTAASTNSDIEKSNVQLINDFSGVSRLLNLLPTSATPAENSVPMDADFAFPGYVPIIARLIESIYDRDYMKLQLPPPSSSSASRGAAAQNARMKKLGWGGLDQLNTMLNTKTKEEFLVPDSKRKLFDAMIPPKLSSLGARQDMIIFCCVGGLTYSEVSTIRYVLDRNPVTKDKQLLILTTGMIKSDDFINAFV